MRKGMKKGMKTALITAGTVTAGAAAVGFASYKVSQYFIRLALDRDGVPMMQRSFQKVCGNVLTEEPAELVRKITEGDTFALNALRNCSYSELAKRYGDTASTKVFDLDDYKMYLVNHYLEQLSRTESPLYGNQKM